MAKKKKTKIGFSDLLMMIMALVGLVLSACFDCDSLHYSDSR